MKVALAVAAGPAPDWHQWCLDALRAAPGVETIVVASTGGAAFRDVDVVVDLAGAGVEFQPRYGVWSFAPAAANDVSLPFAREIGAGARTFEIALVRRIAGRVETLRRGRFPVTAWYPSTKRLAFAEAARWPATLVALLAAGHDASPFDGAQAERDTRQGDNETGDIVERHAEPRRSMADDGGGPVARLGVTVRFWLALAVNLWRAVVEELFEIVEWNVGFVDGDARRLLAPQPLAVRWLPAPAPATLIADPFVVERDGVTALFVETFAYRGTHGAIDALVLGADGSVTHRVRALEAATHLSYPYPLELDGELYLVPENCAGNEVALYRCTGFPDRWERESVIFPAFDGIDTTLFEHDGRSWALCTRHSRGANVALFAFHAPSPRGPWSPHALNPIVCDVSCARPAGRPFAVDGTWYRPGQDCSRSYGGGIAIARIEALTPTEYRETVVRRIDGRGLGRWSGGIHTVGAAPPGLVVDGKRTYLSARKLGWALPRLAGRIGGLLAQRARPTGSTGASPDR